MKTCLKKCMLLMVVSFVTGCAMQSQFYHLGEKYPPTPESVVIELFWDDMPSRKFIKISRLDVHIENTHFVSASFADALPELKRQARLSGAHAITNIRESSSSMGETRIYHVTATGVRYLK